MSRVLALVEGSMEKKFVKEVLAPHLACKGVHISATLIGKKESGVGPYIRFKKDFLSAIKQGSADYYTTMFDYYGLPDDWPGRIAAKKANYTQAASIIEKAIHANIANELGDSFNTAIFFPYIQMHEFEALLFSDPTILAAAAAQPLKANKLAKIVKAAGEPEAINDNKETAPSKRIIKEITGYEKTVTGIIAAARIGISSMSNKCKHFREWLKKLETLGGEHGKE